MNPGVGEPVMAFPSIEVIATAGWSAPIGMEDRTIHVWGFSLDGSLSFVEQCRSWLSEDERGRAARFIRQQDHSDSCWRTEVSERCSAGILGSAPMR